ncbi:unnamed protein product [Rhizoctonia solani]|uniref:Uncharacterized protein n=1 Tax=Rhizoctonia solani TaxID=456999 RepID=A0A8H3E1D5_9AGAM|nr:unnamed protein product [Rhizoctonia solani]
MTTKNNYLPFFAAEYENRRVSIRRAADYDDTISCIQRAFPKLSEIAANRISIAQVFLELGNGMVEINRDTWKDALPWLRTVRVLISEVTPESTVSKKRKVVEAVPGPSTPSSSSVPHRAEGPTGGFAAQSATNTADHVNHDVQDQLSNIPGNRPRIHLWASSIDLGWIFVGWMCKRGTEEYQLAFGLDDWILPDR